MPSSFSDAVALRFRSSLSIAESVFAMFWKNSRFKVQSLKVQSRFKVQTFTNGRARLSERPQGYCSLIPRLLVGGHQEPGYEARVTANFSIFFEEFGSEFII